MRFMTLIILATTVIPLLAARRWRFAVPFPGMIEPTIPEPVHNAFDDMDKKEKIFDTKEVSRRERKPKVVIDDKENDGMPAEYLSGVHSSVPCHVPWML
jgi:hypothetical protein